MAIGGFLFIFPEAVAQLLLSSINEESVQMFVENYHIDFLMRAASKVLEFLLKEGFYVCCQFFGMKIVLQTRQ